MLPSIRLRACLIARIFVLGIGIFISGHVVAATSNDYSTSAITVRLISAQDGVPLGAETLSAGRDLTLEEGWKTYWRSPGEVGIPPQVEWSGSQNVADVELLWPAPERFTAFGIENFGYHDTVVFPLRITLERAGEPVDLTANVKLLICSEVCVPEVFDLTLSLPSGSAIDTVSASRISTYLSRVPAEGDQIGVSDVVAFVDEKKTTLTLEMNGEVPFGEPDVFAELGAGTALGKPDIRLGEGGRRLWAQIPILTVLDEQYHDPVLTVTDGVERALTVTPELLLARPAPPFKLEQLVPGLDKLAWIALVAFLGGLILNVMPCVLPVLSIKLSSAIKAQTRGAGAVRTGFLFAAGGVMSFMWFLAAVLYALQLSGVAVGWGLQFQNPSFLALMFIVLAIFSTNLFGLIEFSLPSPLQSRLSNVGSGSRHGADFATGFFGAVLATPCSAPFLGTAIAFALAGRGVDIAIVFTALGAGLALPYLLAALFPGLVSVFPKPGRWMVAVKLLLGGLLLGTALWLLWVLSGVAGPLPTIVILGLSLALLAILIRRPFSPAPRYLAVGVLVVLPLISAHFLMRESLGSQPPQKGQINWVAFDRGGIARLVSQGEVVFVDVTADWCLTCKANKALVLERDPVLSTLNGDAVVAMQADWTRPDDRISRFLETNDRYGIPFNAVYGPNAPNGIVLSEILSSQDVLEALRSAGAVGTQNVILGNGN